VRAHLAAWEVVVAMAAGSVAVEAGD
jgi:hypothetical protein